VCSTWCLAVSDSEAAWPAALTVVKQGYIKLQYCPTDDMMADILTKVLPCWNMSQHALGLGLCCPCGGVLESGGLGAPADEAESC